MYYQYILQILLIYKTIPQLKLNCYTHIHTQTHINLLFAAMGHFVKEVNEMVGFLEIPKVECSDGDICFITIAQ